MSAARAILIWGALGLAVLVPVAAALNSPLLAWRDPIYIAAGFAGVFAMSLVLVLPLLARGLLPGLPARRGRAVHRLVGALLVLAVLTHVIGLWITSPPDVIDVLTFTSPTPFSVWGVVAMWALFATAVLAVLRRRWRFGLRAWRLGHVALAVVIVSGSVVHALLIEGTMETMSKVAICALVIAATLRALMSLRLFTRRSAERLRTPRGPRL